MLPVISAFSWPSVRSASEVLVLVGIVGMLGGPILVWLERLVFRSRTDGSVVTLWAWLAVAVGGFVGLALTEPGVNATATPPLFAVSFCILGVAYWQAVREGARLHHSLFQDQRLPCNVNWLLGVCALGTLVGLVPTFTLLLVISILALRAEEPLAAA
jgi:hypothetical protein